MITIMVFGASNFEVVFAENLQRAIVTQALGLTASDLVLLIGGAIWGENGGKMLTAAITSTNDLDSSQYQALASAVTSGLKDACITSGLKRNRIMVQFHGKAQYTIDEQIVTNHTP